MKNLKTKTLIEYAIPFIITLLVLWLCSKYFFFFAKVPTESMVPTLNVGDRVIVTRIKGNEDIKRGDILVFRDPYSKEKLVKRLIGMPGDKIDLSSNGDVYVNDELLEEGYVKNQISKIEFEKNLYYDFVNNRKMKLGEYKVPEGEFFFLGDNRSASIDSRFWKNPFIKESDIEGKAQFIFFSLKRIGKIK